MSNRPIGDEVMVRTAARRLATQAAGLVALAMLLLVLLVTVVVVRGQSASADNLLRSTARTADDVGDPPPSAWLVMVESGVVRSSAGLPEELDAELATLRAGAKPQAVLANLQEADDDSFRVATLQRDGRTVQVVLDLTSAHQERARLLKAMGFASAIGLLFAVLLGVLLGRRAVRPLAQALALQRAFIADAGHELRTPLTLLSTRAQLLDQSVQAGDLGEQTKDDSRGVVHDTQRLGEVVEDLLAAADPRGEQAREPVDLGLLVHGVADSAGAHAGDRGVELLFDSGAPRCWVWGSPTALRRAVLSLVDNAVDHTPPGGQVRISLRKDRRSAVITVSDTGPGIAPEAAQHVLRRFHSGGQRAGRAHYGLGLALSHDVANRHGGQLRLVDSSVGATFELSLPVLRDEAPPAPRNS